jgi:hypothetical protein
MKNTDKHEVNINSLGLYKQWTIEKNTKRFLWIFPIRTAALSQAPDYDESLRKEQECHRQEVVNGREVMMDWVCLVTHTVCVVLLIMCGCTLHLVLECCAP